MRAPRIALCTAAVGHGHTQAAMAIMSALKRQLPDAQIDLLEALHYSPRWFTMGYRDMYLTGISKTPKLAGWLYNVSDKPMPKKGGSMVAGLFEGRGIKGLLSDPIMQQADMIVTTHFLCARVLSEAKRKGQLKQPLVVCVTDQHAHGVWLVSNADRTIVASDEARQNAIDSGLDASRVISAGIPINPVFSLPTDVAAIREKYQIPPGRKVVLVSGGGLGLGGMEEVVGALLKSQVEMHVIVVCGHNAVLKARLMGSSIKAATGKPSCEILGFTTEMPDLMGVADVLIGKPGGLTTAEACARGLAMVLLKPIPGQEERNATRLVRLGAAVLQPEPEKAGTEAVALLKDPERLSKMKRAAQELGRPDAAEKIAEALHELVASGAALAK